MLSHTRTVGSLGIPGACAGSVTDHAARYGLRTFWPFKLNPKGNTTLIVLNAGLRSLRSQYGSIIVPTTRILGSPGIPGACARLARDHAAHYDLDERSGHMSLILRSPS